MKTWVLYIIAVSASLFVGFASGWEASTNSSCEREKFYIEALQGSYDRVFEENQQCRAGICRTADCYCTETHRALTECQNKIVITKNAIDRLVKAYEER